MTSLSTKFSVRVRLILFCADHVLTVYHTPDNVRFLPGGGLEHGEGALDCLRREITEECDLTLPADLAIFGLLENRFTWQDTDVHELLIHFTGHLKAKTPPPIDSREVNLKFIWEPLASLESLVIWPPETPAAIRAAYAGNGPFHYVPLPTGLSG